VASHAIRKLMRRSQEGRGRFVLVYGVLGFGGAMFLSTTCLRYIHNAHEFRESAERYRLLISLLVWGIAGAFQGNLMWLYFRKTPKL